MKRKAILAGLGLFGVLALAGCDETNGWDALPISDKADTCYQIQEWHASGFIFRNVTNEAKGTYCPLKVKGTSK